MRCAERTRSMEAEDNASARGSVRRCGVEIVFTLFICRNSTRLVPLTVVAAFVPILYILVYPTVELC